MGDHQNETQDRTKSYQNHKTVLEAQVQHPPPQIIIIIIIILIIIIIIII